MLNNFLMAYKVRDEIFFMSLLKLYINNNYNVINIFIINLNLNIRFTF